MLRKAIYVAGCVLFVLSLKSFAASSPGDMGQMIVEAVAKQKYRIPKEHQHKTPEASALGKLCAMGRLPKAKEKELSFEIMAIKLYGEIVLPHLPIYATLNNQQKVFVLSLARSPHLAEELFSKPKFVELRGYLEAEEKSVRQMDANSALETACEKGGYVRLVWLGLSLGLALEDRDMDVLNEIKDELLTMVLLLEDVPGSSKALSDLREALSMYHDFLYDVPLEEVEENFAFKVISLGFNLGKKASMLGKRQRRALAEEVLLSCKDSLSIKLLNSELVLIN